MPAKKKPPTKAKTKAKAAHRPAKKPVPVPRRAAPPAPRPMFDRIAFTMFQVSDAVRARAFYEDMLGLKRGLASPDGTWTEYDLPGGGCLALFRHPNAELRSPGGGTSVAFEVADLDALNERLVAAGVVYLGDMIHGPNCRMSNIRDSEGNGIILHQLARRAQ
jgi:predicted enzyme related to lactoylglutathione lyase